MGIYPDCLKTVDPETVKRRLAPLAVKNTSLCSSRHLRKPCLVLAVLVVGLKKILSYRKSISGRRHTILGHRAAPEELDGFRVHGPQCIHQREVAEDVERSVATLGRSGHDCNAKSLSDLHRSCQAALFCGASGTILRTPYPPNMRGRMAISFLVAALSSVSPNAKKATLLPSQSTPVQSPFDSRYMMR